jgi:radical SAM protein with 4Fe4S-binding SPASM domain
MDDSVFKNILYQLADFPIERINLSIIGEPLLDPKIYERIYAFNSLEYTTRIVTNASILSPSASEKLIKAGLSELFVSLNGYNTNSHQRMMRFPFPYYERCIENLLAFAELNRTISHGRVRMHLSCLLEWDMELSEVEHFQSYWQFYGFETYIGRPVLWHRASRNSVGSELYYPCPYIFSELAIDCTGRVIGCCRDYQSSIILGNCREESLKAIWTGNTARAIRNAHLKGAASEIPLCALCEIPQEINLKETIRFLIMGSK